MRIERRRRRRKLVTVALALLVAAACFLLGVLFTQLIADTLEP